MKVITLIGLSLTSEKYPLTWIYHADVSGLLIKVETCTSAETYIPGMTNNGFCVIAKLYIRITYHIAIYTAYAQLNLHKIQMLLFK